MKNILLVSLILFFAGCSKNTTTPTRPFKPPYFNKDTANLYILNKQDASTFARKKALVEIVCNNNIYKTIIKPTQFAYFSIPQDRCVVYIKSYNIIQPIFGTRDGISETIYLYKGQVKYINLDFSMDFKAWFEFVFTPWTAEMVDPNISLQNQNSLEKLKEIMTFKPMFGIPRLYPVEADYF